MLRKQNEAPGEQVNGINMYKVNIAILRGTNPDLPSLK